MTKALIALLGLLVTPAWAHAQIETCEYFSETIDLIVAAPDADRPNLVLDLIDVGQGGRCFAKYLVQRRNNQKHLIDFVKRLESGRKDEQSGAGASGAGSTSVVSQGPVAKVLSAAVEYGAFTQSVSGRVVTIRGNAAGLPAALVRNNAIPYCVSKTITPEFCANSSLLGLLRRLSFSVSFNGSEGEKVTGTPAENQPASPAGQPVTFTADKGQITGGSVRLELWNRRDTATDEFEKKFAETVAKNLELVVKTLGEKAGQLYKTIDGNTDYQDWKKRYGPQMVAARGDRARLAALLNSGLDELYPLLIEKAPDIEKQALEAMGAYNAFFIGQDELIDTIATKKVVALEYTNDRQAAKPFTSNLKLIVDLPFTPRTKLILNASATAFDIKQTHLDGSLTRYRDAQAALQLDHSLGELPLVGPALASLAGCYQYQHAPALLTVDPAKAINGVTFVGLPEGAKKVFAEKGDILLFQLKLSVTPKEKSVKVPLSITWSNRTELIDKPTWKAQLGVTYDFDSLFTRDK